MTQDEFNAIAWRDFIMWAWNDPKMRDEFTATTGLKIPGVTTPINAAIDAATGARKIPAAKFIEWATREHWGLEQAPAAYRESLTPEAKHS